jgi:hypothetical protein
MIWWTVLCFGHKLLFWMGVSINWDPGKLVGSFWKIMEKFG